VKIGADVQNVHLLQIIVKQKIKIFQKLLQKNSLMFSNILNTLH